MASITDVRGMEVRGPIEGSAAEVLTPAALEFVAALQREFNTTRRQLLAARRERQVRFDAGELPAFLPPSAAQRDTWSVPPPPKDLQDRRVEITGPVGHPAK